MIRTFSCAGLLGLASAALAAAPASRPAMIAGVDPSMLVELERAGDVYRDDHGLKADALRVMRDHGCNLFRVRLFVHPSTEFNRSWGATQDLAQARELCVRSKALGATVLLDLHYSDTWADPQKQGTPAEWAGLPPDALAAKVHDYTAAVLRDLTAAGGRPDLVQVGNEITSGIMWPQGKVLGAQPDEKEARWTNLSAFLNAGAKAVREASSPDHPIRIMLHIHGGGKPGMPRWFFETLGKHPVDYDLIGLSFYPAWGDGLPALRENMAALTKAFDKDIVLAETSYPWKTMQPSDKSGIAAMTWPMTPAGQVTFLRDLTTALADVPAGHGLGYIWWYPEAVPVKGRSVWRGGAEALFDLTGQPLRAMFELGASASR